MTDTVEYVTLGTDGDNCIVLEENGSPVNISALTRVRLDLGDDELGNNITVDSNSDPGSFDWVTEGESGKLILTLGKVLDTRLQGKAGRYAATLEVRDSFSYPGGLVWVHRRGPSRLIFALRPAFAA